MPQFCQVWPINISPYQQRHFGVEHMKPSLVWVGKKYEFRRGYMWKKAGMLAKITKPQFAKLYLGSLLRHIIIISPPPPKKKHHETTIWRNICDDVFQGTQQEHQILVRLFFCLKNPSPHTSLGSVSRVPPRWRPAIQSEGRLVWKFVGREGKLGGMDGSSQ